MIQLTEEMKDIIARASNEDLIHDYKVMIASEQNVPWADKYDLFKMVEAEIFKRMTR